MSLNQLMNPTPNMKLARPVEAGSSIKSNWKLPAITLFLFIFQNYYNPISAYVTLIANVALFLFIIIANRNIVIRANLYVASLTLLILMWAMFVFIYRLDFDPQVQLKYLRSAASTLLIMAICGALHVTTRQLINTLTVIFSIHLMFVWMQTFFPQLDIPMATIFGFTRELTIISEYSSRKMGASSSYDQASLISAASIVFFYLQYVMSRRPIYFLLMVLSFVSSTLSSRLGMVLAVFLFVFFFTALSFKLRGKKRLVPIIFLSLGIVFFSYFIFPIALHAIGLADRKETADFISASDYGSTGTLEALTGPHLDAMKAPMLDLIVGFGVDPNNTADISTDIGYVKLIYHVGIIGLLLILLLYLYIFRRAITIRSKSHRLSDEFLLSSFLIYYVALITIVNYKSLEMYSRGTHDLLLIIFFVLTNKYSVSVRGKRYSSHFNTHESFGGKSEITK